MPISVRGQTINTTTELVTEECCNCGMLFAVTRDFQVRKINDKTRFYCPNGHTQSYVGQTDAQKQRERADKLERERDNEIKSRERYQEWLRTEREQHKGTERRLAATKGVVTRQKNRSKAGVCIVDGCHRHFQDLQAHMHTEHPDVAIEGTTE